MSQRHSATLKARGIEYKVAIVDDEEDTDPVMLIFRGDEEEAIVTIHLDPESECGAVRAISRIPHLHVIATPPEDE